MTELSWQHRRAVGFAYILSNPGLRPGLLKIGSTSMLSEDRAKHLFTTGVPDEFDVVFRRLVSHPEVVEKRTHKLLEKYRYSPRREYFDVGVQKAIDAVTTAAVDVDGLGSWSNERTHVLRSGDLVALPLEAGQVFAVIRHRSFMDLIARAKPSMVARWHAPATGDLLELHGMRGSAAYHVAAESDHDPRAMVDPVPFLDRAGTAPNGVLVSQAKLECGDRLVWLPTPGTEVRHHAVFEARDRCQVACRTWQNHSTPQRLHARLHDDLPSWMWQAIISVMEMPPPREWAESVSPPFAAASPGAELPDRPPPEYWLPQLARRARR